jgi:hypothetical protein
MENKVVHKIPVRVISSTGARGALKVGDLAVIPVGTALQYIRRGFVKKLTRVERLENRKTLERLRA